MTAACVLCACGTHEPSTHDPIRRLTAERDAARAEATRLREALEACAANIEETGEWGMEALAKTRAALTHPIDQGEGA